MKRQDYHYSDVFRKPELGRKMQDLGLTHKYYGRLVAPEHYGEMCRVLSRDAILAAVEFADGTTAVVPQGCVRRPR